MAGSLKTEVVCEVGNGQADIVVVSMPLENSLRISVEKDVLVVEASEISCS